MTGYEEKIVVAFKDLCAKNGAASPDEVTKLMVDRGELTPTDTVIDIADQMKELRGRGQL